MSPSPRFVFPWEKRSEMDKVGPGVCKTSSVGDWAHKKTQGGVQEISIMGNWVTSPLEKSTRENTRVLGERPFD